MTHEEVQKVLPWYANHRLDAEESRRVEAHLTTCAICRGDVEGLNAVLAAHEKSLPERPVNEARLDALFERIDRHEAERRRGLSPQGTGSAGVSEREQSRAGRVPWWQWLTMRPALAAGSLAAVLLAVFLAPGLFQTQELGQEFSVLSQKGGEAAPFVVRVRFNSPPARHDAEGSIAASIRQTPSLPAYRVEQRSSAEYAIVFESKPSVAAVGQLLTQLSSVANVASTTVDDGADATRN
jgi:hypothetical protein